MDDYVTFWSVMIIALIRRFGPYGEASGVRRAARHLMAGLIITILNYIIILLTL